MKNFIKRYPSIDKWFQRIIFEEVLLFILLCIVLYLGGLYLGERLLMESSSIGLTPIFLFVIIGTVGIKTASHYLGEGFAHRLFILITLGLFILSGLTGGELSNSTQLFIVIFFSLHILLFPNLKLIYPITLWMTFTLINLALDAVSGLIQSALVHLSLFISCGVLLRRTISVLQNVKRAHQESNDVQSDQLPTTAHDIREPINSLEFDLEELMTTSLNHLQNSPDSVGDLTAQLTPMLKLQTQHMDFSIHNLSYFRLNHNKQLTPYLQLTSLKQVLSQVIQRWKMRAQYIDIQLSLQLPPMDVQIYTDQLFLKQILDNLISNALKFSPAQGQVFISVKMKDEDIFIEVHDQGLGIPVKDQERIFQDFKRVSKAVSKTVSKAVSKTVSKAVSKDEKHLDQPREYSIGLGLYIVSLLAPLIHVDVSLVTSSKRGSTFRLTLKKH